MFHSTPNRARGKCSRNSISYAALYAFNKFLKSGTRDFTTFTLHDLTDFYVERATAPHYNKLITHVFIAAGQIQNKTKIKTYLRARDPPGFSGALRSLRILRLGRIGSGTLHDQLIANSEPEYLNVESNFSGDV